MGARVSEIAGLSHLSGLAVKMGEQTINVGDLFYVNGQDYYSTAGMVLASGILAANSTVQQFTIEQGAAGQGFTTPFTENETNNTSGRRMPVNEAYIAWACGYEIYSTSGTGSLEPVPIQRAVDLDKLAKNIRWTYQRGTGPENVISHLAEWPAGNGIELGGTSTTVSASAINSIPNNGAIDCAKSPFSPFLILPPLQDIYFRLRVGTQIDLSAAYNAEAAQFSGSQMITIRQRFKGVRVSTQNPG